MAKASPDYGVIIIGAGVSGLGMACNLQRKLGFQDYLIIERGTSIGGTWPDNTKRGYPGQACDIPAPFYSFSFKQIYWKNAWANQGEIYNYLKSVVDDFKLAPKFRFRTEVIKATWNSETNIWHVEMRDVITETRSHLTCKVLIGAVGTFQTPNEFKVEGKDKFKGTIVHSGEYDPNLDLTGKNVAVLGNGCSAIQIVPNIASKVKSVTQFVRTKHWILPRPQVDLGPLNYFLKHFNTVRRAFRTMMFFTLEADHKMMHWESGRKRREAYMDSSKRFIKKTAPQYYDTLVPDFQLGSKRRIFDTSYVECLNRPNVDILEENVKELTETGIKRQNGEVLPIDVIILATGFQVHNYFHPMSVIGEKGVELKDHVEYKNGHFGYLGTYYHSMPNFASIMGLATGQGHSSVIFTAESAINMVIKNYKPVLLGQADAVVIKEEIERDYFDWHNKAMADMIWKREKKAKAWYTDADGQVTALFPHNQIKYWWKTVNTGMNKFIIKGDRRPLVSSRTLILFSVAVLCAALFYASADSRTFAYSLTDKIRRTLKL